MVQNVGAVTDPCTIHTNHQGIECVSKFTYFGLMWTH